MERHGEELHAETDEARAGSTPNIVRWVLLIGLLLAILLLSATWIVGALNMDEQDQHQNVNRELLSNDDGRGTDSIVSDAADESQQAPPATAETNVPSSVVN